MKTIAIIGQKGGTGKTNLAKILLAAFGAEGRSCLGIDLDPQASLCRWDDRREAETPAVMPMLASRLPQTLESAERQGIDIAVIDTAGRARDEALAAVKAADLVVIPLQPTTEDLETFEATQEYLSFSDADALAVLVMVEPRGPLREQASRFIEGAGMKVCPFSIGRRAAYRHASTAGLVPTEYEPAGKAAEECGRVHGYISKQLEGREHEQAES